MGGNEQHRREQSSLAEASGSGANASGFPAEPVEPESGRNDPLACYDAALESLKAALPRPSSAQVVPALLARDRVDRLLEAGAEWTEPDVARLAELDAFLTESSVKIESALGDKTLSAWKQSMNPGGKRWWWSLDEVAASARVKLRPSTGIIATVLLGVSFAVTADTVGQLIKVAALSAGLLAAAGQAALTFFTGSALTETGRKAMLKALASLGIKARLRDRKVLAMAIAVLVLSILARQFVPGLAADFYVSRGDRAVSHEAWSQAIDNYNRAITLRPTVPDLHSKVAFAYDKSQQFDRAIEEYNDVAATDDKDSDALSSLARLYLLQRKDPYTALRLLDRLDPRRLASLPNDKQYAFLTNSGWATMEIEQYDVAEAELKHALNHDAEGVAAHYLRGRVLEALNRISEAQTEFATVIRILQNHRERAAELEPDWILYAQKQSFQGGGAK